MVGCDSKCVCTDVAIKCPHGELVATAVVPRALLASDFAAQLSNDEVSLIVVLNAGLPNALRAGKPRGYRVFEFVGFLTPKAAAQHILRLSKDCKVDEEVIRKKFGELSALPVQQHGRVLNMRCAPPDEASGAHAVKQACAVQAAVAEAAHTVNAQLLDSAVQRAAVMGSNRKLQRTDQLLTHRRKTGQARGQRVEIGGVDLKSLNPDLLAAHRSEFCRVSLHKFYYSNCARRLCTAPGRCAHWLLSTGSRDPRGTNNSEWDCKGGVSCFPCLLS